MKIALKKFKFKKKEKELPSPLLLKRSKAERVGFTIVFCIFVLYSVSLIFPFIWVFINSLKGSLEYSAGNTFALPEEWLFSNYKEAFETLTYDDGMTRTTFLGMIFNSLWYTVLSSVISVFSCSVTGYCLSKYEFRLRKYMYAIAIFCMTIPIVGTTGAYYKLIGDLGLYDTPMYVVVTSISAWGFNFLVMYGFFKNVSWTYAEAAFVDGGGHFLVFFKIMLPLAIGPIVTLLVVSAIGHWNDYMTMLMYVPSYPTLASGLYSFQATAIRGVNYPIYFAGLLISLIPVLILFAFCSDIMMSNMSVGGIKA